MECRETSREAQDGPKEQHPHHTLPRAQKLKAKTGIVRGRVSGEGVVPQRPAGGHKAAEAGVKHRRNGVSQTRQGQAEEQGARLRKI